MISFQPALKDIENIRYQTHFILSGFLRKSWTFKLYPAAMQYFGIEGKYLPYELPLKEKMIDIQGLKNFLKIFKKNKYLKSILVSDPYKKLVLEFLDECTPEAKMIGAVNLIVKRGDSLFGENKDGQAFLMGVEGEKFTQFNGASMFFFGCGGVSSAISFILGDKLKNIGLLDIYNGKSESLKHILNKKYPNLCVTVFNRKSCIDFSSFDIFYNGTGLGKFSEEKESIYKTPLIKKDIFPECGLAIDANYTPEKTQFLKTLSKKGFPCLNGFSHMLSSTAIHLSCISGKNIEYQAIKDMIKERQDL